MRNKHCRLGEEVVCPGKWWQGRWVIKVAWCGSGASAVRKRVPPCPVLQTAALVSALRPKAENLKRFQRGVIRENSVLNPLLTAVDVSRSRWCVYLTRRWRGCLGLSLKFCMSWRILKGHYCALTIAGQNTWKVENQKNSNCKCLTMKATYVWNE